MARKPNATPPQLDLGDNPADDRDDDLPIVAEPGADASASPVAAAPDESEASLAEQLEAERRRAERAEREAEELRKQTRSQQDDIIENQRAVIDRALQVETNTAADLKRQITEAKQSGDYAQEVDLLDKLQKVNLKITRMEEGKNQLDILAEQRKDAPEDPVEAYVAQLHPRAANWVRQHPEFVTNKAKNEELNRAHYRALGNGMTAGTDEYFDYLENELEGKPERRDDTPQREDSRREDSRRETQRRPPPAPVSRGRESIERLPPGVTRRSDGTYRMSPEQYEAARISGLSPGEYLKNLLAIQAENGGRTLN